MSSKMAEKRLAKQASMKATEDAANNPAPGAVDAIKAALTQENIEKAKQKAQEFYETAKPYVLKAIPYILLAIDNARMIWAKVSPMLSNEVQTIVDALYYFALLFFGGYFAVTIACYQAFKICGADQIMASITNIQDEATRNFQELKNDETVRQIVDKNNDGEFSADEVKEAIMKCVHAHESDEHRKEASQLIFAIMKIVDPEKFLSAFGGLWAGLMAIYATMRSQMAQSIVLGQRIGGMVAEMIKYKVADDLYEKFSDHKKWVDSGIQVSCSLIAIMIATVLQRMVSAGNSAMEGSRGLCKIVFAEAHTRGIISHPINIDSNEGMVVVGVVCAIGFLWQLTSGFRLPFLLQLLLFPLVWVESILTWGAMS